RETGKPYTYIHDGALMVEEASRKFLAGMNPYVADYLDTPMFFWPMINNPALYHLTYFPFMFLVTGPFVWFFDHFGFVWDQRYLYLPAYIGTLALVPFIVQGTARRLAMTAAIALNPQLFPFVVEGRNDFFVLLFLLATFVPFLANNFGAFYDDVVSYNAGGAAWTYPISGMGFSAILLALGLIPYRQADFPFALIEIAVAAPIAAWWFIRLWQRPTIATLLAGYALTLLAFLFFGRYFQGNYLGFIAAVFTPVPFLATRAARRVRRAVRRPAPTIVTPPRPVRESQPAPSLLPVPAPAPVPVA